MEYPSVMIFGSCNIDLIIYVEKLPKAGETVQGSSFTKGFGGKGANQCVAAAKLGAKTALVSKVGDDSFGNDYLENLKSLSISTDHVKIAKEVATGVASIVVNEEGENSIAVACGANMLLSEDDINEVEDLIRNAKVVASQREIPVAAAKRALALAKKHGVRTVFNAAPADCNLDADFFHLSDVFCVNETEAEIIVGFPLVSNEEIIRAAETLIAKDCKDIIITLGKNGALLSTNGCHTFVEAPQVEAIDTTGAGDSFVGTLAYFLATKPELTLVDIVRRSCKVASITTTKKGTQASLPSLADLDKTLFE